MSRASLLGLVWAVALAAVVGGPCAAAPALATADGREAAPALHLPGGRLAAPGRTIELTWTAADSVRELEVLMSVDDGRHYLVVVSPQLDPRARRFRWRVPSLGVASVRLRIRYNHGGREIEGPPTAAVQLQAGAARAVEPLGLPPLAAGEAAGERAPARPASPARAGSTLAATDTNELHDAPLSDPGRPAHAVTRRSLRPLASSRLVAAGRVPAFVPLRA